MQIKEKRESFSLNINNETLLEYPQYTLPREFNGMIVPEVLLSGNHKKIKEWKENESLKITKEKNKF